MAYGRDAAGRRPFRAKGRGPGDHHTRVLIYSHDTFGLGHLRRSRAIANALVSAAPGTSIVIVSGSPVVGSFEFGSGVDWVRVPGVTKLPDGDYRSLNMNMSIEESIRLREAIILQTAESLRPDIFIVDKEPTGFRGEVVPTLERLSGAGCRIVLGARDVMDEPSLLVPEWERKGSTDTLSRFYDEIWVYGLREIYEPLAALPLPDRLSSNITYTGYLRRDMPGRSLLSRPHRMTREPFILVTAGGGGDGEDVVDWVISAYEAEPDLPLPALIVFGPFMSQEHRGGFLERISRHPKLDAIAFDAKIERLMSKATAIVGMGGYNTFCEILSFDKPSLIVPRTKPRREQLIRALAAERLGLASAIVDNDRGRDPLAMAAALKALPGQAKPSTVRMPGLLDGLDVIRARVPLAVAGARSDLRDAAE